jgi:hypothetical protein
MANESSNLFLHRHPMMENKCNIGLGHVIVDVNHWEATLVYLQAHPDLRTEIHNSCFGQLDEFEELPLKEKEDEK